MAQLQWFRSRAPLAVMRQPGGRTPTIVFRHLPPNSVRTGYASVRALFIPLRSCPQTLPAPMESVLVLIRRSDIASKHARKHEARPDQRKREFCLDSDDFGFVCAGVSNVAG